MYVLNHKKQVSLIAEMTQLRKDSQTWEVYYHHPSTNAMWKSYFPKATKTDWGPKVMRTEPVPDCLGKRLENCLVEDSPENAIGLGLELSLAYMQWREVMDIVEENYRRYHRKQLPLFLKNVGIERYKALFKEINVDLDDHDISSGTFDKLAYRSQKVRLKRFWFP